MQILAPKGIHIYPEITPRYIELVPLGNNHFGAVYYSREHSRYETDLFSIESMGKLEKKENIPGLPVSPSGSPFFSIVLTNENGHSFNPSSFIPADYFTRPAEGMVLPDISGIRLINADLSSEGLYLNVQNQQALRLYYYSFTNHVIYEVPRPEKGVQIYNPRYFAAADTLCTTGVTRAGKAPDYEYSYNVYLKRGAEPHYRVMINKKKSFTLEPYKYDMSPGGRYFCHTSAVIPQFSLLCYTVEPSTENLQKPFSSPGYILHLPGFTAIHSFLWISDTPPRLLITGTPADLQESGLAIQTLTPRRYFPNFKKSFVFLILLCFISAGFLMYHSRKKY